MSPLADAAVYPQTLDDPPTWHVGPLGGGPDTLAFLSDLIDDLTSRYSINRRRGYATGISNGEEWWTN